MKRNLHLASYFVVLLLVFTSCKKNSFDAPIHTNNLTYPSDPGYSLFVSATEIGTFTQAQLQSVATQRGFGDFAPLIKYYVDFYKIVYKTMYKGSLINVSGLLCIPKGLPVPPPLLSAQHGTMFAYADAPSNFPLAFTGFELFASAGFMTVIPDFIGYGASQGIVHPYYDMQTSGATVADMLVAVKYYLKTKSIPISSKLFLVGYSEGGYVTMAAQKEIETNPALNLTLTAAAEGAGGYDITGMLQKVGTLKTYPDPSFFALFVQGYNTTYGYKRPLTNFFKEPYADEIPGLLNGTKNSTQINAALTTSVTSLLNADFYCALTTPGEETVFKAQVAANSFPNWFPISPTRLYHGTADEDVFFETSQTTYLRFLAEGAQNVTFIPIPGGTHETSVEPMMLNVIAWFSALAQGV